TGFTGAGGGWLGSGPRLLMAADLAAALVRLPCFFAAAFLAAAFLPAPLRLNRLLASHESRPVTLSPWRNRQPSTPSTSPLSIATRPPQVRSCLSPTPRSKGMDPAAGSRVRCSPPGSDCCAQTIERPSKPAEERATAITCGVRMRELLTKDERG